MASTTSNKRLQVNAGELSKCWAVGKQVANETVKATTQLFI